MKAMIFSDLITSKNSFAQLLGMTLFVAIFIAAGTSTLVTSAACIAAMVPFMYLFSISAYDEQSGWERFRLTLPISRRQVAYGRYASMMVIVLISLAVSWLVSMAIGFIAENFFVGIAPDGLFLSEWSPLELFAVGVITEAVIILAAAVSLPLIMRFGMTKGSRLVPVIMVFALCAALGFFTSGIGAFDLEALLSGEFEIALAVAVILLASFALYVISACISARLYETREL